MPLDQPPSPRKVRDPRLDFFRGAALLIIFIAHFRGTWLAEYIPARFGLSDAADTFVFCSGYAAAIAFGGTFLRLGYLAGLARIVFRCGQLYAAQIGLFFASVALCLALSGAGPDSYLRVLGLHTFFDDAPAALLALATLRYVPHYFDILPLYIAVLAMVPAAMLLARVSPLLPVAASVGLYLTARLAGLNLTADPLTGALWYFNPLCWQLVFFTGFALGRGWVAAPLSSRAMTASAALYAGLALLTSMPSVFTLVPPLAAAERFFVAHADKTDYDLWRYTHFLATAQLAIVMLRGREHLLLERACRPIVKCGQQALPVFLSGMVLSHACSILLIKLGGGVAAQTALSLAGIVALIGIARLVAWFKRAPWKRQAAPTPSFVAEIGVFPGAAALPVGAERAQVEIVPLPGRRVAVDERTLPGVYRHLVALNVGAVPGGEARRLLY